jgi:ATP-dependent Lon protease
MRDFRDAKAMAQTLRDTLKTKSINVSHGESLELVAKTLGFHDWNVLSAAILASQPEAKPKNDGAAMPVTPMRDVVFLPQLLAPIFVGRDKTKKAIESAMAGDGRVFVVTQKRAEDNDPDFDALYSVGVIAHIIEPVDLPNGNLRVKVSCSKRAVIVRPRPGDFLAADIEPIEETRAMTVEAYARMREILDAYPIYAKASAPPYLHGHSQEPGVFADVAVWLLRLGIEKTQQALEIGDVVTRLETILAWMKAEPAAA